MIAVGTKVRILVGCMKGREGVVEYHGPISFWSREHNQLVTRTSNHVEIIPESPTLLGTIRYEDEDLEELT